MKSNTNPYLKKKNVSTAYVAFPINWYQNVLSVIVRPNYYGENLIINIKFANNNPTYIVHSKTQNLISNIVLLASYCIFSYTRIMFCSFVY